MELSNILDGLNTEQARAVLHDHKQDGPLLILAGAGSGKTSVLTRRIQHRIASGVLPSSILALTFTALAAEEMRERVEKLFPGAGVRLCTFHSLALSLLRNRYEEKFGYEYLGFQKPPLPKEIFGNDFLCDLASVGLSPLAISREELFSEELPRKVQKKLEACKERVLKSGAVVFDDLIYLAISLIEKNETVKKNIRAQFSEILVDEYQDINLSQYRLVRAILGDNQSLFAVGDDDQAIYGFRGADIGNILRFRKDFPGSSLIRLEWNYRSVPKILDFANRIFKDKPLEFRKTLRAGNGRRDALFLENRRPEIWKNKDPLTEIVGIVSKIREIREDYGVSFSDFAIISRYNRQKEYYETALRDFGLPVGGDAADGVQVLTVHASKGLQYLVVFYAGLAENLTPGECTGSKKSRARQAAEERRLFYVGVTRAEAYLVLLYCRERFWKGKKTIFRPSRFLSCMEPQIKESHLPLFLFKIVVAICALAYMGFAIFQIAFRRLFRKEISSWLERRVQEFAAYCMKILRVDLSIENQALLAKIDWSRPLIVVANHQSYVDIPVIFLALGRNIGFLAKYELTHIPFLNFWMKQLGCVFVRRKSKDGGVAAQQELLRTQTPRIAVFPEGTRSKDGSLHPFKSGGFRLAADWQATILPIVIHGTRAVWEGRKNTSIAPVSIKILEPLDLKKECGEEKVKIREFLIPEIRRRIEEEL